MAVWKEEAVYISLYYHIPYQQSLQEKNVLPLISSMFPLQTLSGHHFVSLWAYLVIQGLDYNFSKTVLLRALSNTVHLCASMPKQQTSLVLYPVNITACSSSALWILAMFYQLSRHAGRKQLWNPKDLQVSVRPSGPVGLMFFLSQRLGWV